MKEQTKEQRLDELKKRRRLLTKPKGFTFGSNFLAELFKYYVSKSTIELLLCRADFDKYRIPDTHPRQYHSLHELAKELMPLIEIKMQKYGGRRPNSRKD